MCSGSVLGIQIAVSHLVLMTKTFAQAALAVHWLAPEWYQVLTAI